MASELLDVASSLLAVGSVAAESLLAAVVYGFGLLMKLSEWIFAFLVQVIEFFPAVFEFLFAAGEWIVTAFISGCNYLLTVSYAVAQMVWYGLVVGSSATWNGIVTGVDFACSGLETLWSGLLMLPDIAEPMWNVLVTGTGFVWKGLVIGGGTTWQALVFVSTILWNGLTFVAIVGWFVLTNSLHLLLSLFNALAYVTYELGFLIAGAVQAGLRAALSMPSVFLHVLESKKYQLWIDAIQNSPFYKYFHMVYTSFKLNVKFITDLPALVLPDNVPYLQIFCTSFLIIVVVYALTKRKRGRNQTELRCRHESNTTERRPRTQRRAARAPPTVSANPTSNQILTNRRPSGSISPRQLPATDSEDPGVLEQRLRELELKLDREKEQQMCVVCLDNKRLWMLKPCNHYCVCDQCVHQLSNKCPICRKVIRNKEKVFHA